MFSLYHRLFRKVIKTPTCWLWRGSGSRYGYIRDGKRTRSVHKVSWELHFGEITNGLFVLHKCDNPLCVNPDHLFLGTQLDNMQDMKKKSRGRGRAPIGVNNGQSKLSVADVCQIRHLASNNTHDSIAQMFGISRRNVGMIVNRVTWKEV